MKHFKQLMTSFALVMFAMVYTGCATMNDLLGTFDAKEQNPPLEKISSAPRYSDNPNMGAPTDRQYKRMTKNRMEEESDLGQGAGSMWVMDGQGSYLFAQNKMRREGDLMTVRLDGPALKQVETKVSVIKKLLKQLEDQENQQNLNNNLAEGGGVDASRAPAAEKPKADVAKEDDKNNLDEVQNVPTRLVEKLADGNYRVKGQQPFMIGKREYKVIVTGLIRPEDFNDAGISSDKLLDPQYDVVSIRRNSKNE